MRPEDFERLTALAETFDQQFGQPVTPENAIQRVLIASAALAPVHHFRTQQGQGDLAGYVQEWFTPMVADAIERAFEVLGELYETLESEVDDVQILEPGTIGNQQFQDLGGGAPLGRGGDLIR